MRHWLAATFFALIASTASAQLSRLVYLDDLEDEPGVIEISSQEARTELDVGAPGDVDGDGLDDVLFGVASASRVLLIFGQPGLPRKLDPLAGAARMAVINIDPSPAESPGVELGGGADVNGDGVSDFLVGCERRTAIVFGSRSFPDVFSLDDVGRAVPGVLIQFPRRIDRQLGLGAQTASLGADLNGDAIGEILLGDPEWPEEAPGKGIAHVIFGSASLPATVDLRAVGVTVPGFQVAGTTPNERGLDGDNIGIAVEHVGDVDGDGFGDLGIAGSSCSRGSYLIFGRASFPPLLEVDQVPGLYGVYFHGMSGSPRALGDLNGDGRGEFTLQSGNGSYDLVIVGGRPRGSFPARLEREQIVAGDRLNKVIHQRANQRLCPARLPLEGGPDVDGDGRADLLFSREPDGINLLPDPGTGWPPDGQGVVYFFPTAADLPAEQSISDFRDRWGYSIIGKEWDFLGQGFTITIDGVLEPRRRLMDLLPDFDGDGAGDLLLAATPFNSRAYVVPVRALLDPELELGTVSPSEGHVSGGDIVQVSGRGLAPGTRFYFGSREAEAVATSSQHAVHVRVPPLEGDSLTVDVTAVRGARTSLLQGAFHYYRGPLLDVEEIAAARVRGAEIFTEAKYTLIEKGPAIIEAMTTVRDISGDGIDDIVVISLSERGRGRSVIFGGPHLSPRVDFLETEQGIHFKLESPDLKESGIGNLFGSGDVDGDGVGDLAVSTNTRTGITYQYVILGGADLPRDAHPSEIPRRIRIANPDNSSFRIVRDLDGGGRDDLVTTAYDPSIRGCGANSAGGTDGVWILRGENLDGVTDVEWASLPKLRVRTPFLRIETICSLDANGDGIGDLALGAKRCGLEGLLVLFGGAHLVARGELSVDGRFLEDGSKGASIAGLPYAPELPSLGFSLAALPDLDGDGGDELLAGNPLASGVVDGALIHEHGEAHLLNAKAALEPLPASQDLDSWIAGVGLTPIRFVDPAIPQKGTFSMEGPYEDRHMGWSVAAGDFDADGMPDLAIGEGVSYPPDCPLCGGTTGLPSTFILHGRPDMLAGGTMTLTRESLQQGLLLRGAGFQLDGGRDVNGDGIADLLASRERGSVYALYGGPTFGALQFTRGDVDLNEKLEISDAIRLLGYLFLGDNRPRCLDAGDVDDDGVLGISDAIRLLGYLFLGGAAPEPPFPESGTDPTPDSLGCGEG